MPRSSAPSPTRCCSATGTSSSPACPRRLLNEIVTAVAWVWPIEVVALLLPTGMLSVWSGSVDDGWGGMLGWIWGASAVTTIVLVFVTRAALREREYSAVMAATGLLYLAILTAFGTDLDRPRRARRLIDAPVGADYAACHDRFGLGRSRSGSSRSL